MGGRLGVHLGVNLVRSSTYDHNLIYQLCNIYVYALVSFNKVK